MSIVHQLSSQTGDRTEHSNRKVADQCLETPGLLDNIAVGLQDRDAGLQGDCAEVLTMVAEDHPEWVVPYSGVLSTLVNHKNTRVRWEVMHALSLVAGLTPSTIASLLPTLTDVLHTDTSIIVRDHATDAISAYASTGTSAAEAAYPILNDMLTLWNGKQAGHALLGMINVARLLPDKHLELRAIATEYSVYPRPVVRKAARALLRVFEG